MSVRVSPERSVGASHNASGSKGAASNASPPTAALTRLHAAMQALHPTHLVAS
ncbi:MAG: hypothetical protein BWX84_01908 [Verrucomicrobia bacterium ADurb.Bin118]|nr:MAG: hypothetical protein BWX84_01908 [Verrucomicrobia bacterium ADurb.Bin118]